MTSATFKIIKTRFEVEAGRPGGKPASIAVVDAYANLAGLSAQTLPVFEEGLVRIRALIGPGKKRPSDEALEALYGIADVLVGYCLTINRPGLTEALVRLAKLCDSVRHSRLWIPGSFPPLIETIKLALEGSLTLEQASILIENIDLCIARYGCEDAVSADPPY